MSLLINEVATLKKELTYNYKNITKVLFTHNNPLRI